MFSSDNAGRKGPSAAQRLAALQAARKRTTDRMTTAASATRGSETAPAALTTQPTVSAAAVPDAQDGTSSQTELAPAFKKTLLAAQQDVALQDAIEAIENDGVRLEPAEVALHTPQASITTNDTHAAGNVHDDGKLHFVCQAAGSETEG
jgi:hypothetical protein